MTGPADDSKRTGNELGGWNLEEGPPIHWVCTWVEGIGDFSCRAGYNGDEHCARPAVIGNPYRATGGGDGCCIAHLNNLPPDIQLKRIWGHRE